MIKIGSIIVLESRSAHLAHRVFPDAGVSDGYREWFGFRVDVGGDYLAFPFEVWLPAGQSQGIADVRDCLPLLPRLSLNPDGTVDLIRAGMPTCRFADGFCPRSQETLYYDSSTGHYILNAYDGLRYEFGSNAGANPVLDHATLPSGLRYNCVDGGSVITFTAGVGHTLSLSLSDAKTISSVAYKATVNGIQRTVFSLTLAESSGSVRSYSCQRMDAQGAYQSFTLEALVQTASGVQYYSGLRVPGLGAAAYHESVELTDTPQRSGSFQHDRVPASLYDRATPIDSEATPFLSFARGYVDGEDFGYLSLSGPLGSGTLLSSFDNSTGLCAGVAYDGIGRACSSIASVPFAPPLISNVALSSYPIFENGFGGWSRTGSATVADVEGLPSGMRLWPVCNSGEARNCVRLSSGASLTKSGSLRLLSDAPYAFCFIVAASPLACVAASGVTVSATLTLNGGGSAFRSASFGKGSLCPGNPTLLFLDLSSSEGATGYSVTLTNASGGEIAVAMGALFAIPVSRTSHDSHGLVAESTAATSYERNLYSDDLRLQRVGAFSSPLVAYDGNRRPIRSLNPSGGSSASSYAGDTARLLASSFHGEDGYFSEGRHAYLDPWNAPYRDGGAYGWSSEAAFGLDGSVVSVVAAGLTSSVVLDSRWRPTNRGFSWAGGSIFHSASYSPGAETFAVDGVSGTSQTHARSSNGAMLTETFGGRTAIVDMGKARSVESESYEGAGSVSYSYVWKGLWLVSSCSAVGSLSQQAVFDYDPSGSVLVTVGSYSCSFSHSASRFRSAVQLKYSASVYWSATVAGDPCFGASSVNVTLGSFGQSGSINIPSQRARCADYPAVRSKFAMAGSSAPDLFAAAADPGQSEVAVYDGVPSLLSSLIYASAPSSGKAVFAALLYFSGQTVTLNATSLYGGTYVVFRHQNGTAYFGNGSSSYVIPLSGWHCLAFSFDSGGSVSAFVDDALVSFSMGSFTPMTLSLGASSPMRSCLLLSAQGNWGADSLYEAVRDCLGCILPPSSSGPYAAVSAASVPASGAGVAHCDFDGNVLLGTSLPHTIGGVRRIRPAEESLCSIYGGPVPSPRFRYDWDLGRKCWACSGDALEYSFSGKTVALLLRIKPFRQLSYAEKRVIFEIGEGSQRISCYLLGGTVRLSTFGTVENTGISLAEGSWHSLAFRFVTSQSVSSSTTTTTIAYGVKVGSSSFSKSRGVSSSLGSSSPLSVGRETGQSAGLSAHPFLGLVGDLWLSTRDYSLTAIAGLDALANHARFEARSDSLGRLSHAKVETASGELVREQCAYDAPSHDYGDGATVRQTTNLKIRKTYVNGTLRRDESLGYDASTGRLSSLVGQAVEYFPSGFLKTALGETFTYRADGSMLTRSKAGTTRSYSYDGLRLTSVSGVASISYAGSSLFPQSLARYGAPSLSFSYFGAGRVAGVTVGGVAYSFLYDERGSRCRKSSAASSKHYRYDGSLLAYEGVPGSWAIAYGYDSLGRPAWLDYHDSSGVRRFYFLLDALGSIVEIIDGQGATAVALSYDALGLPSVSDSTSFGLASKSSLRYKGYVYDHESGLYFLGFRFYDPSIGRFLSPDDPSYLDSNVPGGLSPYVYCYNDPVTCADNTGHFPALIGLLLLGFGVGAAIGAGASVVTQGLANGWDQINGWQVLLDAGIGGLSGMLSFSGINAIGMAFANGFLGFVGSVGGDLIANDGDWSEVNWAKAAAMGGVNMFINGLTGPGVLNKHALGDCLSRGLSGTISYKALLTASARYGTGAGFRSTWNLYGNQMLINAALILPKIISKRVLTAALTTAIATAATTLLSWGAETYFGW